MRISRVWVQLPLYSCHHVSKERRVGHFDWRGSLNKQLKIFKAKEIKNINRTAIPSNPQKQIRAITDSCRLIINDSDVACKSGWRVNSKNNPKEDNRQMGKKEQRELQTRHQTNLQKIAKAAVVTS